MRILGIDPGSRFTGVGLIDHNNGNISHVHHQVIKCGTGDLPSRLNVIFDQVNRICGEFKPDVMGIETVFMAKNANSALKLGQARGAAICGVVVNDIEVNEYAPRAIKQAVVGNGSASKEQVQYMVSLMLKINGKIQNDAADALGVAICHAHNSWAQIKLANSSTSNWRQFRTS